MRRGLVRRFLIYYLVAVGITVHVAVAGTALLVWHRYGFAAAARKAVSLVESTLPHRAHAARWLVGMVGIEIPGRTSGDGLRFPAVPAWSGQGAFPKSSIDTEGEGMQREIEVGTGDQLHEAIKHATAGDRITLLPGTYRLEVKNISVQAEGTPDQPIVVRAKRLGDAVIEFDALEGFLVHGPNWHFENLEIHGICASHSDCEHAFHIVGDARGTVVRNSILRDFNAAIKGNGSDVGGQRVFPDDVLVEGNTIYNTTVRDTDNPVTPIDVVGANGWVVRRNLIADFAKGQGNRISYAAFFKGNSANGIFEKNLVICEMNVLDPTSTRLGLSFGGGGSVGSSLCRDGTCHPEHTDGIIRNNIVLHCNDVGIYLNRSASTQVLHNTLFNTAGIDIQFPESHASIANNLLSGDIRDRRGGVSVRSHNLVGIGTDTFREWFVDPDHGDFRLADGRRIVDRGDANHGVLDDFCGTLRSDGSPDIGAIEYIHGSSGCDSSPAQARSGP